MNIIRAHCIGWSLAGAIVLAGVGSQSLRPTDALRGPALALVGATVIDGTGGPPIPDVVVVVEGGRIVGVGPRARMNVPPGALQRDVAGLTILPGLIDSHVHLIFAIPQALDPAQTDAVQIDRAVNSLLERFLRYGVTNIRDLGDAYPWIIDLARSINTGSRTGPRILAAGPLITAPGGHPAGTLLKGNAAIRAGTRQVADPGSGRAAVNVFWLLCLLSLAAIPLVLLIKNIRRAAAAAAGH